MLTKVDFVLKRSKITPKKTKTGIAFHSDVFEAVRISLIMSVLSSLGQIMAKKKKSGMTFASQGRYVCKGFSVVCLQSSHITPHPDG